MTQRDWHPRAFFRALSDDVAHALACAWGLTVTSDELHGANALARAFTLLEGERRERIEASLRPLHELCEGLGREALEKLALERWQHTRPTWVSRVVGFSTPDLIVRLYLEDARAVLETHAQLQRADGDRYVTYRGKYVADVVPSFARKSRMKQLICDHFLGSAPELVLEGTVFGEGIDEEKFSLFVCRKEHADELMAKGPMEVREPLHVPSSACPIALVFEFASAILQVKAPTARDRESLRRAFAQVFANDPTYFEDASDCDENVCRLRNPQGEPLTLDGDQITHVHVDRVIVRKARHDTARLTVEFESGLTLDHAVRALRSHGVRLVKDHVEGAGLVVHFAGGGRTRKRSILLEHMERDRWPRTRRERVIQHYLRAWNLDADRRNPLLAAAVRMPPTARDGL